MLIVANGIFSASEIAMVSARKVRLEHQAERGDRRAAIALRLARSPNDFLSTVQIGITLIGILSGAVGGATVAQRLTPILAKVPWLAPYAEGLSVALVVTAITYLSLVLGELAPKRIALSAPEAIACGVSPAMRWLSQASAPLVYLLGESTDRLLQLLGIRVQEEPDLTEEEIKALIRQGAESGVFEEAEHAIVQRVFRLGDRPVKSVMTPRRDIVWLNADLPHREITCTVVDEGYSRYPVARGRLDACIGTIRGHQLLAASLLEAQDGEAMVLEDLLQPPLCVAESIRVLDLIGEFRRTGIHIALVTDEYGGIEGLVTVTDLMEAIVGDL
ncbi:MAG: hemolysin family protein, partial [Synechococcaceae cyanobacterium]|nr:hemolysin family protein [Synechococcaceae cyanobacterium]